jgi:hypothetical protein
MREEVLPRLLLHPTVPHSQSPYHRTRLPKACLRPKAGPRSRPQLTSSPGLVYDRQLAHFEPLRIGPGSALTG